MKAYKGSWGRAPLILNLGTGWMWVVYLSGLAALPPVPTEQKAGGGVHRDGLDGFGKDENLLPLHRDSTSPTLQSIA